MPVLKQKTQLLLVDLDAGFINRQKNRRTHCLYTLKEKEIFDMSLKISKNQSEF